MKKMLIISLVVVVSVAVIIVVLLLKGKEASKGSNSVSNSTYISNSQESRKNVQAQKENSANNGLKIEVLKKGMGEEVKNGDVVSVNYVGRLENGTKFDSSIDRGVPFNFQVGVGQVIKGWDIGVLGMKVGEKRKLTIPSSLAYGKNGVPGTIPPNAVLVFEIDLLSINK